MYRKPIPQRGLAPMWLKALFGIIVSVIMALLFDSFVSLLVATLAYFLWNWLMPEIFAIKVITFWQAWGITFLSGILFNSHVPSKKRD